MVAGLRNKRVRFERLDSVPDGFGNPTSGTWSALLTVWGRFRPMRASEKDEASRLQSQVTGTLSVLSSSAARQVTEADRVLIDGVPYQIRGITNPDQRNRELVIEVERGVAT